MRAGGVRVWVTAEALATAVYWRKASIRTIIEAGRPTTLTTLLAALGDVQLMDRFVATLYEAHRIQALAEIGLILYLLRALEGLVGEIRTATQAEGDKLRAKGREDEASATPASRWSG